MAGIFSLCNSQLLKSVALFLKGISKRPVSIGILMLQSLNLVI
jgi:hypothetical protein